ncbi:protein LAX PANICLE 2-like [Zingiber officinale]|uniref:protein LAX PANICLE 2-like n=1 Tax=Zingiber officinale TaxID=94328 RepID=UPI001C4B9F86|nr:protein LAX PANICLE 2-like [Zingiber officinale]
MSAEGGGRGLVRSVTMGMWSASSASVHNGEGETETKESKRGIRVHINISLSWLPFFLLQRLDDALLLRLPLSHSHHRLRFRLRQLSKFQEKGVPGKEKDLEAEENSSKLIHRFSLFFFFFLAFAVSAFLIFIRILSCRIQRDVGDHGMLHDAMIPDLDLLRRHRFGSAGLLLRRGRPHFHDLEGPLKPNPCSMAEDDEPSPAPKDGRREDDGEAAADWLRLALAPPLPHLPSSSSASSSSVPFTPFPSAWPVNRAIGFREAPSAEMAVEMVPWIGVRHHRREPPPYWGRFWNVGEPNLAIGGGSALMLPPEFVSRQFLHSMPIPAMVPRLDVRMVSPPRRLQSTVWVTLQALRNQTRVPLLPQIPRSYLRIKDGRMTIRLLIKYLVNKLGLEDESEVEMTCRGQTLLPSLSLVHVRDHVWCSSREPSPVRLVQNSPTGIDHIMMIHYGRTSPPPSHV